MLEQAGREVSSLVSIHSRLFKPGEYAVTYDGQKKGQFQSTPDYLNRENAC